ncbi:MAG: hypothetical protein AAF986_06740 [Pseudomonadota bacterium]
MLVTIANARIGVVRGLRYRVPMRVSIIAFCLTCLMSPAWADQLDPSLPDLFEALRSGDGDVAALQFDIQAAWLRAPEAGIGILVNRTIQALETEDVASAGVLTDHITGLAPHYAEGWMLKGHLALLGDDRVAAELAFGKVVSLEPRHFLALEKLGDLALLSGDEERAHQRYREALDWNPHLGEVRERADRLRTALRGQEI